jgi:hypothetical protein
MAKLLAPAVEDPGNEYAVPSTVGRANPRIPMLASCPVVFSV